MTIITVDAERSYSISLTNSWNTQLAALFAGRARVAVIVSKGFSPDLAIGVFVGYSLADIRLPV